MDPMHYKENKSSSPTSSASSYDFPSTPGEKPSTAKRPQSKQKSGSSKRRRTTSPEPSFTKPKYVSTVIPNESSSETERNTFPSPSPSLRNPVAPYPSKFWLLDGEEMRAESGQPPYTSDKGDLHFGRSLLWLRGYYGRQPFMIPQSDVALLRGVDRSAISHRERDLLARELGESLPAFLASHGGRRGLSNDRVGSIVCPVDFVPPHTLMGPGGKAGWKDNDMYEWWDKFYEQSKLYDPQPFVIVGRPPPNAEFRIVTDGRLRDPMPEDEDDTVDADDGLADSPARSTPRKPRKSTPRTPKNSTSRTPRKPTSKAPKRESSTKKSVTKKLKREESTANLSSPTRGLRERRSTTSYVTPTKKETYRDSEDEEDSASPAPDEDESEDEFDPDVD